MYYKDCQCSLYLYIKITYNVNMDAIIQYIFPNEKYEDIENLIFKPYIKDNHIYFTEYNDVIYSVIKYAKYTKHPASFVQIGRKIGEIVKEIGLQADLIIYVPMYITDQKRRGFNQSMILAEQISRYTDIEICHKALKKVKKTRNQASLNAPMRSVNLHNAFIADDRYTTGRRIILVDDIYTTGTTLNECKKVLMESMADSVIYITVTKKNI